jgi:hypothetical protein
LRVTERIERRCTIGLEGNRTLGSQEVIEKSANEVPDLPEQDRVEK